MLLLIIRKILSLTLLFIACSFAKIPQCGMYLDANFWNVLQKTKSVEIATDSTIRSIKEEDEFISKVFIDCNTNEISSSLNFHEGLGITIEEEKIITILDSVHHYQLIHDSAFILNSQKFVLIAKNDIFDLSGQFSEWFFKNYFQGKYCNAKKCVSFDHNSVHGVIELTQVGIPFDLIDNYGYDLVCGKDHKKKSICLNYKFKNQQIELYSFDFENPTLNPKLIFKGKKL